MQTRGPHRKLDYLGLWDFALRALGRRALSSGEIRVKLEQRAEDPAHVSCVVNKLVKDGYLDDQKFAENYAAARKDNDGFGKHRVLSGLRQRRVPPGAAENAVLQAFEGDDEAKAAGEYLRKKYRGVDLAQTLRDPAKLAAAYRRLRYGGFSGGAAIRALKVYTREASQIEEMPEEPTE